MPPRPNLEHDRKRDVSGISALRVYFQIFWAGFGWGFSIFARFPQMWAQFGQRDTFHRSRNACRRHRNAPFDETEVQPKFNVIKKTCLWFFSEAFLRLGQFVPILTTFRLFVVIFGEMSSIFGHFLKIIFSIPRRVFRDPDPSVTESVTKALHTAGRSSSKWPT